MHDNGREIHREIGLHLNFQIDKIVKVNELSPLKESFRNGIGKLKCFNAFDGFKQIVVLHLPIFKEFFTPTKNGNLKHHIDSNNNQSTDKCHGSYHGRDQIDDKKG